MIPQDRKGFYIVLEGIDGSGTGTVMGALENYLKEYLYEVQDFEVVESFNMDDWLINWQNNPKYNPSIIENDAMDRLTLPLVNDEVIKGTKFSKTPHLQEFDILTVSEPFYMGLTRNELIKSHENRDYCPIQIAQGYSLERNILLKRIIEPFLEKGGIVISSRNVASSLVYQSVDSRLRGDGYLKPEILTHKRFFPGNHYAINDCPPDFLQIKTGLSGEDVMKRIEGRESEEGGKQDGCRFENADFQSIIAEEYVSDWLRKMFEEQGTRVNYLEANKPKEIVAENAIYQLKEALESSKKF
jgi:thymidylate kinase